MLRGEPIWQTRSTSPMSMPSSSEAVATSTRNSPRLRRCSASSRYSLARLPWCAATCSPPRRSARWRAMRSAMRRVLTNTSVVRCRTVSSASLSYTRSHTSLGITASSGTGGSSSPRSRARTWPTSTTAQSAPVPARKCATVDKGFCVADRPMRTGGVSHKASSRSRLSDRWLPRLLPATAWISSTITVRTPASMARPLSEPSSTYSDSGVDTRMCGARRRMALRSAWVVSPVRTALRMPCGGSPIACNCAAIPSSGASRFTRISLDKAFNGETYSTRVTSGSGPAPLSRTSASIAARKAVSVLPEPVGAAIRVGRPAWISGQARRWASVAAGKVAPNHAATAGWKSCQSWRAGRLMETEMGAKWANSIMPATAHEK